MSTSVQQISLTPAPVERRFYPRIAPNAPIFLAFGERDETLLLNISENGLLVSTPRELIRDSVARLSITLSGLAKPVQVHVRVLWTNEARKLAGVQLLDLCEYDRERIRKWAARESAQSLQPNRTQTAFIARPSPVISETRQATTFFAEKIPAEDVRDEAALVTPTAVASRRASATERCVIAGLYVAAAALVAVFFFRNEAMGNPFARLKGNPSQVVGSALQSPPSGAQIARPANIGEAYPVIGTQPAKPIAGGNVVIAGPSVTKSQPQNSPAQSVSSNGLNAKINRTPVSTRLSSNESQNTEADSSDVSEPAALTDTASEDSSALPQISSSDQVLTEASQKSEPETTTLSPAPSVSKPLPPSPANTSNAGVATSATVAPSASTAPHLSSMTAPARPTLSPNSAPSVIRMDPPRNQTLEVHLSSGYQSSFFGLPGHRILETPSITMSIQRSVLMPSTRGGWLASHNKKVVLGELISRADPQLAQAPIAATVSVRVQAIVAKDGHVENVRLVSGPQSLAPAVTRALREWRYQPTFVDDKPVKTQSDITFQFHALAYRAVKR